MELTTNLHRKIVAVPSGLMINSTTDEMRGIAAALTPAEARQIADAIDPDRAATALVRDDYTLDEARAEVARLEAAERAEAAKRDEGIRALAVAMSPESHPMGYWGPAQRAYDRGVRAPSTPTTEEN